MSGHQPETCQMFMDCNSHQPQPVLVVHEHLECPNLVNADLQMLGPFSSSNESRSTPKIQSETIPVAGAPTNKSSKGLGDFQRRIELSSLDGFSAECRMALSLALASHS